MARETDMPTRRELADAVMARTTALGMAVTATAATNEGMLVNHEVVSRHILGVARAFEAYLLGEQGTERR